jgi:hypothetical protein
MASLLGLGVCRQIALLAFWRQCYRHAGQAGQDLAQLTRISEHPDTKTVLNVRFPVSLTCL